MFRILRKESAGPLSVIRLTTIVAMIFASFAGNPEFPSNGVGSISGYVLKSSTVHAQGPTGSKLIPVGQVGGKKQLFVDDHVVEKMQNVKRVLNQAQKYEANPVLVGDKAWDSESILDGTVIRNAQGLFKLWYWTLPKALACYATSQDGVKWTKPELGLFGARHKDKY